MTSVTYQPVVIIGAPRSGTNMLRDVLVQLPDTGTWPCDEINYIWRHGNIHFPSDEFDPDMATPSVAAYIQNQFARIAKAGDFHTVVEKTCANSLRVGFVSRVLPEAKFIFIYRNGLDVVASAIQRWRAGMDLVYLSKKARYVPPLDVPYYASRYLMSQIYRVASGNKRVASWGPKLNDMQGLLQSYSLEEVCGLQWKHCIESASNAFSIMPESSVVRVCYEDFVSDPLVETRRIAEFIGVEYKTQAISKACRSVSPDSVGKGVKTLGSAELVRLHKLLDDTLGRFGYV